VKRYETMAIPKGGSNRCHVPDDAPLGNVLSPMTRDRSKGKSLHEIRYIACVQ